MRGKFLIKDLEKSNKTLSRLTTWHHNMMIVFLVLQGT